MQIFGVPASGSPTSSDFAISFWANLYSGIISGVITGIVAGVVIWIVQLLVDKRRTRKSYAQEIELFRKKLHSTFCIKQGMVIESALGSQPYASNLINQLLELNPVDSWKKIFPKDALFSLIYNFSEASFDFTTKAGNLDLALKHAMRVYNAAQGRISSNDADYRSYFFGRLHGLADEQILPHIDRTMSSSVGLQNAFNVLSTHSELQPLIQSYLLAQQHLSKMTEQFRNC